MFLSTPGIGQPGMWDEKYASSLASRRDSRFPVGLSSRAFSGETPDETRRLNLRIDHGPTAIDGLSRGDEQEVFKEFMKAIIGRPVNQPTIFEGAAAKGKFKETHQGLQPTIGSNARWNCTYFRPPIFVLRASL